MRLKVLALTALLFFSAFIFSQDVFAQKVKSKGRIGIKNLTQALGGKLINAKLISVAADTGNIFMLVRNAKEKTRDLEWVLYDPVGNKVLKSGKCDFKFENRQVAVSPDAKYAAAFSAHPSALWFLDIESGKWSKCYVNPKLNESGIAIRNPADKSPLVFVNNTVIGSVLEDYKFVGDKKDKKLEDIISVFVKAPSGKLEKSISLKEMLVAGDKAMTELGNKKRLSSGQISVVDNDMVCFTLKSVPAAEEFLFLMKKGEKARLVDSAKGSLKFLDYNPSTKSVLYSILADKKDKVILKNGDKKVAVFEGIVLNGKALNDGHIALTSLNDKSKTAYVLMGQPGAELTKIASFPKFYLISITRNGKRLIMTNPDEMLWSEISK